MVEMLLRIVAHDAHFNHQQTVKRYYPSKLTLDKTSAMTMFTCFVQSATRQARSLVTPPDWQIWEWPCVGHGHS